MALFQPNFTHTYSTKIHILTIFGVSFQILISKYTEYDNIFINASLKFFNKNFEPTTNFGKKQHSSHFFVGHPLQCTTFCIKMTYMVVVDQ